MASNVGIAETPSRSTQGPTHANAISLHVAIVEHDLSLATLYRQWLKQAGHRCQHFVRGDALIWALDQVEFDAVLVDWNLVHLSRIDLIRRIRCSDRRSLPILVSGPDREHDVVSALRQGADDYLVKPARRLPLLARLEAIARRGIRRRTPTAIEVGSLCVDCQTRTVLCGERLLKITGKEFDLLVLFLRNMGRLLSRSYLVESVWGPRAQVTSRTVDTHVSRLRRKLALAPENGWRLVASYGRGYRLVRISAGATVIDFPPRRSAATPSLSHSEASLSVYSTLNASAASEREARP